jgi:hypothetical protein
VIFEEVMRWASVLQHPLPVINLSWGGGVCWSRRLQEHARRDGGRTDKCVSRLMRSHTNAPSRISVEGFFSVGL